MKSYFKFLTENKSKPLYVKRNVISGGVEIHDWAKKQLKSMTLNPKDMHVTIAFSRKEVDWKQFRKKQRPVIIHFNRTYPELLGENSVVLKFDNSSLTRDWKRFKDGGCSWDYESYQPHITVTYNYNSEIDLNEVEPFTGTVTLGPEIFEELDLSWKETIEEI